MEKKKRSIDQLSKALLELLVTKGYSPGTLKYYRLMLSRISVFMKKKKVDSYTESIGDFFFADYITKKTYSIQYQRTIKTVLRRLNELHNGIEYRLAKQSEEVSLPLQFSRILEGYSKFCKSAGNKENSIAKKRKLCYDLFCHIDEAGCKNVNDISAHHIHKALLRINNKDSYAVIRSMLQYLHDNKILGNDFSGIIPTYRRPVPLPATYSDEEIHRLENSVNRATGIGKRDYAIILLASRLGIRSADIAGMAYDNIDFINGSITFNQKKTGRPLSLPLLQEIHEAIHDYIQYARPNVKTNCLFIQAKAPYEKITTSIIRNMLTVHFKAAQVDILSKKHGPHALRCSMASSMVNNGVPYDVVRKALGHIDPQAIKHYAKVDIENLRLYAIDVPAPTGAFAKALQGRE
jgi:site-specific recombinase XerD